MALTNKDVYERVMNPVGLRSTWGGTTLWDDWRNAAMEQRRLEDLYNSEGVENEDYYNNLKGMLRGDKAAAGIQMGITGLSGLGNIIGQARGIARNNDTQLYDTQIDDFARQGAYNYNDYSQLSNDYANNNFLNPLSYKDIRGMNKGQEWGSVGATALSGASTGFQMFGPLGAVGGAFAGGMAGLIGMNSGRRNANTEYLSKQTNAMIANNSMQNNYEASHNRLGYNNNVNKTVHSSAMGGTIERKQQNIRDFAQKVTGNEYRKKAGDLVISHGEGGTRIRIKK